VEWAWRVRGLRELVDIFFVGRGLEVGGGFDLVVLVQVVVKVVVVVVDDDDGMGCV